MTVTAALFADYIGGESVDAENPRLILVLGVAKVQVLDFVKSTCTDATDIETSSIPEEVLDLAILKVADELWNQRNIKPRVMEQIDYGGAMLSTTNRDPMLPAYSLLRGYVLPW